MLGYYPTIRLSQFYHNLITISVITESDIFRIVVQDWSELPETRQGEIGAAATSSMIISSSTPAHPRNRK